MENRVKGKNISIDYKDTLDFFNSRGSNDPLKHKYNYVLFQDEHPELAIQRDKHEKEKICACIDFDEKDYVLDVGCGVGRWGEEILHRGMQYVGIDYSSQLLAVAQDNLKEYKDKCTLICSSAQELSAGLDQAQIDIKFDKVFINGVMMYLNDADLEKCFDDIGKVINSEKCTIYIKETVGTNERLTLNKFFSKDLKHEYTAIYRTVNEYENFIKNKFVEKYNFTIKECGDLFSDELKNRAETKDYYFILSM